MRAIKLGIISLVFFFILITLISLLIPSHIRISKATNLPNKRDSIFALVKTENLFSFSPTDSSAKFQTTKLQKKRIEQTDSTYVIQLQQQGRQPIISGWQLYGSATSDSLTLQWYMDFHLSWYPWKKFSSLFFETTYGRLMETGLADIKKKLSK